MKTDKRPFYIWVAVLLANIGTILFILFFLKSGFGIQSLIILIVSVFATVVPILISNSNNPFKNRFGYGISVVLLLPIIYFVYDYFTCTGKFCQLTPLVFGWGLGIIALIFATFYTIGIFAKKWNNKFILSLIVIELILLIVSSIKIYNDYTIESYIQSVNPNYTNYNQ